MGAEGYCVNIPWSRGGVGDNDYIFAFQHVVLPIGYYLLFLYFQIFTYFSVIEVISLIGR